MKYEKQEIDRALKQICAHRLFVNSSIYTRLLTYLVEKALANEDLKEYTIGADLFGKNYLDDKNDGTVRSYMYKLRKKLAAYYSEVGDSEKLIFELKKGQYKLSFVSSRDYFQQQTSSKRVVVPLRHLLLAAVVLAVVLLAAFFVRLTLLRPKAMWMPFLKSEARNLLVISDQFIVHEINPWGEQHATLYPEINNAQEFIDYSHAQPERKLETTDYTLISKMAPFCVKYITGWFKDYNADFQLRLESTLSFDDIRGNNLIFVGQYKTMNISRSLFLKNSKVFSTYRDGFMYKKGELVRYYNTQFGQHEKLEYAMVSFAENTEGSKMLYFVSNNDIGVMATVRNFTDAAWLAAFYKKLPQPDAYFNALFEVQGLNRTEIGCKLVELECY